MVLLYGYKGTGKTRLSTTLKDIGRDLDSVNGTEEGDTLHFKAFTGDLFS